MRKTFRLITLFFAPFFLLSCETDFDVIGKYKEVAIVYGLLNQNDSIHYLRINKAFLGDGNALTYAKVADSSTFGADINVILTEVTPTGQRKDIVFDTITLSTKDTGEFYSPNQLFYFSKEKLDEDNNYELKVTNKKTSYTVNSQTSLIHTFYLTKPSSGSKTISFKRSITQTMKFSWTNGVNAKRYQLKVYFNYKELTYSGDTIHRKVAWPFEEVVSDKTDGSGSSEVSYVNEDFYVVCNNHIPYTDFATEETIHKRYASTVEIEVTAIGDEFNTYLDANAPSTGVLIEKPTYSNITNGFGLLSCRYQIKKLLSLSPETILDLATTTDLKFEKPY
jgi:hypothetical protein